jgi:hypothetical protein
MPVTEGVEVRGFVVEIKLVCPACDSEMLLSRSGEINGTGEACGTGLFSMSVATNIHYIVCKDCAHTPMRLWISRNAIDEKEYARRMSYQVGWRPTE